MNSNKCLMQAILDLAFDSNMPDDYARFLSEAMEAQKITAEQYNYALTEIRFYLKYDLPLDLTNYGNIKEHLGTNGFACNNDVIAELFKNWHARPIIGYSCYFPAAITEYESWNTAIEKLGNFNQWLFAQYRGTNDNLNFDLLDRGKFKLQNEEGKTAIFGIVRTLSKSGQIVEIQTLPKYKIDFDGETFAEVYAPNISSLAPYWQALVPSHVDFVRIDRIKQTEN